MDKYINNSNDIFYLEALYAYFLRETDLSNIVFIDRCKGLSISEYGDMDYLINTGLAKDNGYKIIRRGGAGGAGYLDDYVIMFSTILPIEESEEIPIDEIVNDKIREHQNIILSYITSLFPQDAVNKPYIINNDIKINNKKCSGCSSKIIGNKIFTCSVLSFKADYEMMSRLLYKDGETRPSTDYLNFANVFDYAEEKNMDIVIQELANTINGEEKEISSAVNQRVLEIKAKLEGTKWVDEQNDTELDWNA